MDADLQPVADALAKLTDAELHALSYVANELMLMATGPLSSWVEHFADWELDRRTGLDFPLEPPDLAIPPDARATSVDAAIMLRARFAQTPRGGRRAMVELFDAMVGALARRARLQ
jgi:hypothetical protein